jgi:hypothetical protein
MSDTFIWVGLSIVAALGMAGMALVSEFYKLPTVPRLFWLRVFSLVAALPFAFVIDWPDNPRFYICVFALTAIICLTDILYYGSARDNGAGPTSRIEPLSTLLTFVAWTAITPSQFEAYTAQPLRALGILGCFLVAGYCAMELRHSPISLATLKKLSVFIVLMVAVNILGKTGMDAGGNPLHAVVAYVIIQAGVLIVFNGVLGTVWARIHGSIKPTRGLLISAGMMAVGSLAHVMTKNVAYTFVSNPAYVSIVLLSAPLFVSVFYHFKKRPDDASVLAGFGIVASAAALIVLTRF